MKVYLTSIGETTTDVAVWAYQRLGYEVVLIKDEATTFYQKYGQFLQMAENEDVVIRADADVIPTKGLPSLVEACLNDSDIWWGCGQLYCHLRHELIYGGINIIKAPALFVAKARLPEFKKDSRPETRLTRVPEFMQPRRYKGYDIFAGLHAYKQSEADIARVLLQKSARQQLEGWDWALLNKLGKL